MPKPVIIDGLRTPFVKAGAHFDALGAHDLGRMVVSELLCRLDLSSKEIEDVIYGNISQDSKTANPARVIALNAGIPRHVPAHTVARNCASGMEAIAEASDKIRLGESSIVMCGGTESMSNIPLIFPKKYALFLSKLMRAKSLLQKIKVLSEFRLSFYRPRIALLEGLTDPFCGLSMGQTAEVLAREWQISRDDQDQYALQSHERTLKAQDDGKFLQEMMAVYVPPKYDVVVTEDIGPRRDQSFEKLQKLKPVFDRRYGTVTAGNSCQITDGAVSLVVISEEKASVLGYSPLAKIKSYAFSGCDPKRMGLGPVFAAKKALDKAGLTVRDIGLWEINEAFATQVMAVLKAFGSQKFAKEKLGLSNALGEIDPETLNVNGGAIALGHPVGASGARIVLTLMKEMQRRNVQFGLATLCVGGGQGGAMILERVGS